MTLNPSPVPSSRFGFDPTSNRLTAEASDLGDLLGRVWDDACDVGLTVVSDRTGARVTFVLGAETRDGEGELLYTDFEPANPRGPGGSCTVRLYND